MKGKQHALGNKHSEATKAKMRAAWKIRKESGYVKPAKGNQYCVGIANNRKWQKLRRQYSRGTDGLSSRNVRVENFVGSYCRNTSVEFPTG